MSRSPLRLPSSILVTFLLAACSGGHASTGAAGSAGGAVPVGPSPGGGSTARARFLIGDAVAGDLLSFSADVVGLRLVRDDRESTENLLSGPIRVEFLGLDTTDLWLAQAEVETGAYVGLLVDLDPLSVAARAPDGSRIRVDAASGRLSLELQPELVLGDDESATVVVDLDLLASISGEVASGELSFDPRGVALVADPRTPLLAIEEIDGLVRRRDTGTLELVLEAFADDDRNVPIGPVSVRVDDSTLLVDRRGTPVTPPAYFYTYMTPGLTLVEVHGALEGDGTLRATRIEIEDNDGGAGETFPVKLAGRLEAVLPGVVSLQLRDVEKGARMALPVLEGLGSPGAVRVSLSTQRVTVMEGDRLIRPLDLAVGQRIKAAFQSFPSQPFPAARVDVSEPDARHLGVITEAAGRAPEEIRIRLRADEPAVLTGLVESSRTEVVVELRGPRPRPGSVGEEASTSLSLALPHAPLLAPADLIEGLSVVVNGDLAGDPDRPVIAGRRVLVHPGLLDGAEVTATNPALSSFTTMGGALRGSFGGGVSPGPFIVRIEPRALFRGAAASAPELFALFDGLTAGQRLVVAVEGIGAGAVDEIRAFQIVSRLAAR